MTDSTNKEAQVIGLCLTYRNVALEAVEKLPAQAFQSWRMRNLFEGIGEALKQGKEADMVSVPSAAPPVENFTQADKTHACIELSSDDSMLRVANKFEPIYQLRDGWRRFEFVKIMNLSLGEAQKEEVGFNELISSHSEALNQIDTEHEKRKELSEQTADAIKEVEMQAEAGGVIGLRTSLTALDKVTGGLQQGQLIIVAGRPGMGKTVLGMNIALSVSNSEPVMVFSLEMTDTELVKRAVVSESNLTMQDVFQGQLNDERLEEFRTAAGRLEKRKLIIDDYSYHLDEIAFSIRRQQLQTGVRLVVVDYLQLIRGYKGRSDTETIKDITHLLKELAKQLKITIVLLSQLNREVEQRPRKIPQMSDLKQSGSTEEDANIIVFCYRPEYYGIEAFDDNEMSQGLADLIVAKNRNGRTGAVRCKFEGHKARFLDRVKESPEPFHETSEPKTLGTNEIGGDSDLPF